jgi:SAM-dependent methyltransferase
MDALLLFSLLAHWGWSPPRAIPDARSCLRVDGVRFAGDADTYDRFMGRYSVRLAPSFADFAQVASGQRVLDVGCGPGALTTELVRRLEAAGVAAVDPSEQFVAAARERHPGVDVRVAAAEGLPFADDEFDAALAQLVVHFMNDPVVGLAEMARVTRSGGVVAACVWDHAGGLTPVAPFWDAVHGLDPNAADESRLAGGHEGHLTELMTKAGLRNVQEIALPISVEHTTFDEWWEPFTLGVGPAGTYLASLDRKSRDGVRRRCNERLGPGPVTIESRAWTARGDV